METLGKYLVSAESLLSETSAYLLFDLRSGEAGFAAFQNEHLAEAQHLNLEWDLADKPSDPAIGGRHPLPDLHRFAELLGKMGITPETVVVIYDDKQGANAAARFWWMLQAVGHQQVYLIDGGYQAAITAGYPTSDQLTTIQAQAPYPVKDWSGQTIAIDAVAEGLSTGTIRVIDVRDAARYRGETEPIDAVAGHIPGAVNLPLTENVDKNGCFFMKDQLLEKYEPLIQNRDPSSIVIHCGSGVTACHSLFSLANAGLTGMKLYVGSWSEWSRSGRERATGANPIQS